FRNAKNDGFGVMTYTDGYRYEGQWVEGKRSGRGVAFYPKGPANPEGPITYVGPFAESAKHGKGVLIDKNSAVFFVEHKRDEYFSNRPSVTGAFPELRASFNSLPLDDRKIVQSSLKAKGLYSSGIDGAWGRNTMVGVFGYAAANDLRLDLFTEAAALEVLEAIIAAQ
ncbi:hypothetical protein RXV90_23400, partial [Rhodophyticola sp. MJ-SS7]|nr:hypothetical protein [Rhodophyticola sp. MJ-SS7]